MSILGKKLSIKLITVFLTLLRVKFVLFCKKKKNKKTNYNKLNEFQKLYNYQTKTVINFNSM